MNVTSPLILARPDGATIAYHRLDGAGPGIVFLGGFRSDMTGTKALFLEEYCRSRETRLRAFRLFRAWRVERRFADGTISRWRDDAISVIDLLTTGPQILVGSSMGGYVMLLAALARQERIAALVGIAGAPDFTEELLWPRLTPTQRREIEERGRVVLPSDYDPAGYLYTRASDRGRAPPSAAWRADPARHARAAAARLARRIGAVAAEPAPRRASRRARRNRDPGQRRRSPPLDPGRSRAAGADPGCARWLPLAEVAPY